MKKTGSSQFPLPAPWDMGWAEGLVEEVVSRTPEKGAGLGYSQGHQRRAGVCRGSWRKSQEPHWCGGPEIWLLLELLSQFNYFVVLHGDPSRGCRENTGVCGLFSGEIRCGRCRRGHPSQGQSGDMKCPKGPTSLFRTRAWPQPLRSRPARGSCLVTDSGFPTRL